VARPIWLLQTSHARGQHPFETAHPVSKIGNFLTCSNKVGRSVADALVEENDLAKRADRIAVQAHAAAISLLRRAAGPPRDDPARILDTSR
jgi:hypothetical protein